MAKQPFQALQGYFDAGPVMEKVKEVAAAAAAAAAAAVTSFCVGGLCERHPRRDIITFVFTAKPLGSEL